MMMTITSLKVVNAIRNGATKLEISDQYQWGHMGSCNCGFIAQEVTGLKRQEIHRRAMLRYGDWTEQLNDYCPASGFPMDDMISELIAFGFTFDDLKNLERLSDPRVLSALPTRETQPQFNVKEDVVTYMKAWANLLEEEMLLNVELPKDINGGDLAEVARISSY